MLWENRARADNVEVDVRKLFNFIFEYDHYTWAHSVNVAKYAFALADLLGMGKDEKNIILLGALLHDIGKIQIPETILKKPGKLNVEEWRIMKAHPELGYKFLKSYNPLMNNDILDIVLHHHERFDGQGYPHGLVGEEISFSARIVTVADCFDAMTSNRAYSRTRDKQAAALEILNNGNRQFDPFIAEKFVEYINKLTDHSARSIQ
jgi:putative nucleotidyltransferase with HDIG domain